MLFLSSARGNTRFKYPVFLAAGLHSAAALVSFNLLKSWIFEFDFTSVQPGTEPLTFIGRM